MYSKLDMAYKKKMERYNKIEEIFNDYNSIIYLEYASTLFDISNRGGYERMAPLDNVFYKNREINLEKFKNKVVKINGSIYCQIEKDNINNRNECFDIFTKITKEHLKILEEKTLKVNIKEIEYINNGEVLCSRRSHNTTRG